MPEAMTLREFCEYSDIYLYTQDHYEMQKAMMEMSLINLHLNAYEYMHESTNNINLDQLGMLMVESASDNRYEETEALYMEKAGGVIGGIKKLVHMIAHAFKSLWNKIASVFKGNKDKKKKLEGGSSEGESSGEAKADDTSKEEKEDKDTKDDSKEDSKEETKDEEKEKPEKKDDKKDDDTKTSSGGDSGVIKKCESILKTLEKAGVKVISGTESASDKDIISKFGGNEAVKKVVWLSGDSFEVQTKQIIASISNFWTAYLTLFPPTIGSKDEYNIFTIEAFRRAKMGDHQKRQKLISTANKITHDCEADILRDANIKINWDFITKNQDVAEAIGKRLQGENAKAAMADNDEAMNVKEGENPDVGKKRNKADRNVKENSAEEKAAYNAYLKNLYSVTVIMQRAVNMTTKVATGIINANSAAVGAYNTMKSAKGSSKSAA